MTHKAYEGLFTNIIFQSYTLQAFFDYRLVVDDVLYDKVDEANLLLN